MALPFLSNAAKRLDQVVAVDLGARRTKAVHMQKKGDALTLLGYTVQDAPILERGAGSVALGAHLRSISKTFGEQTRQVALAVGVPDSFLRLGEMPPMPVSDMRQMLRINSKTYLQQDYPDHVFDCWIIIPRATAVAPAAVPKPNLAGESLKQRVLVGGTKRQTLDDLKVACKEAALMAFRVEPGMVGPTNALEVAEPETFAKEVVALVDIGFKNTTITLLKQGELVMNRVVTIGGDRFTAGLAEALGISYAEAEGIKVGMPAEVEQNLESGITTLGRELRASIDFFEHQQDVTVGQVLVSGGSARSEFIVHTLQNEMMVSCRTWNPAKTMQLAMPTEQRLQFDQIAPELAVALGAAASAF